MFSALNYIDDVFLGFVLLSSMLGLVRGFWLQIISLAVWLGAAVVYYSLGPLLRDDFVSHFVPAAVANWVVVAGLFIIFFFIGVALRWLAAILFAVNSFTFFNKAMGLLLGFAVSIVLVLVVVYAVNYTDIEAQPLWRSSVVVQRSSEFLDTYSDRVVKKVNGQSIKRDTSIPTDEYTKELA